jgi:hypothetical protein
VIGGDEEPRSSTSPLLGQEYESYDECGQEGDRADAHGKRVYLNFTRAQYGNHNGHECRTALAMAIPSVICFLIAIRKF